MTRELVQLARFKTRPYSCSYLPHEIATMEYRVVTEMSEAAYGALLIRGWRRFGAQVFRHACVNCAKCLSLRVDVANFEPTRSQRRNAKGNHEIVVDLRRPSVTSEHVALYNAYHADMHARRGWTANAITEEVYRYAFLEAAGAYSYELNLHLHGRLVGVGLMDVLPVGISAAYFYHDPALRDLGLGVCSVLNQIELARKMGLPHVYLGYCVEECPSLAYKANYGPHEILVGRPREDEEPVWVKQFKT